MRRAGGTMLATCLLAGTLVAALATPGISGTRHGVFWLKCAYSHSAPDDPITKPGLAGGSHLHDFFGNRSTGADSTDGTMLASTTTCGVGSDTAGYWFPALLRADGTVVEARTMHVYYWGVVGATEAYPQDFKLVAGATVGTPMGYHMYYFCRGTQGVHYTTLPDCGTDLVRDHVEFPSCWDGSTSYDSTGHVAYPIPGTDDCPASNPRHLPRLILHVTWSIRDASNARLASDGPDAVPGSTLHADFWNTWKQQRLEELVATCINADASCRNLREA